MGFIIRFPHRAQYPDQLAVGGRKWIVVQFRGGHPPRADSTVLGVETGLSLKATKETVQGNSKGRVLVLDDR